MASVSLPAQKWSYNRCTLNKQTQKQTSNVIWYSFHVKVAPLNGEEEEIEQTKRERNNKQTSIEIKLKFSQ